jgi:hypothetical protein
MFPERDYPGLDHPATDNPVILTRKDKVLSSTESFKNKKEQQQTNVVFYDSLNDDRLSQDDKQSLMRYPEERVQKAFEFAKSTKIKTTLVQVLVWHCTQVNPPLPGKKNTLKLECQKAAIGLKSENCEFHVSDEGVTFVALVGQMQPITIKYTDEDAKNKILQKLKHFKFKEIKN